jgi:hypothetical protein
VSDIKIARALTSVKFNQSLIHRFAELRADGVSASVINEAFSVIDGWVAR